MVELEHYGNPEVFKKVNSIPVRTIVETQFYGNNVINVGSVEEAYELARRSPGTVELTVSGTAPSNRTDIRTLPHGNRPSENCSYSFILLMFQSSDLYLKVIFSRSSPL